MMTGGSASGVVIMARTAAARDSRARRNKERVTLTLTPELVSFADEKAARTGGNRSQVVDQLLAEDRAREEAALAAEGYRFFNREAVEFAEMSLLAASEAILGER